MSASRIWPAFVDGVLVDLGVSAAYRARAMADIEAMIGAGFFEHVPLEWFAKLVKGE
jgi:hypothetical protein